MDRKAIKNRIRKTLTRICSIISFAVLLPLSVLCFTLGIVFISDAKVICIILITVIAPLLLIMFVVLIIVGDSIDKKRYGKGRLTVQFNGELTLEKKRELIDYMIKRYQVERQDNALYFTYEFPSTAIIKRSLHFNIFYLNGAIKLEAYGKGLIYVPNKENGVYGFAAHNEKLGLRELTAYILNMLNAPDDIIV